MRVDAPPLRSEVKSPTGAWASTRPSPMTTISSAVWATSASTWLESSTVPPAAAKSRSVCRSQRMPSGSSPLDGSSSTRISGSPSSAPARPRRWRMPWEKPPMRRLAASASPTWSSTAADARSRYVQGAGQHREMTGGGPAGVPDVGVEQSADEAARIGQIAVAAGAEECATGCWFHEPEQRAERRGLAGAVGAEEADDRSALHAEADVADGVVVAVGLGELVDRDDGVGVSSGRGRSCACPFGVAGKGRAPASRVRGRGRWT